MRVAAPRDQELASGHNGGRDVLLDIVRGYKLRRGAERLGVLLQEPAPEAEEQLEEEAEGQAEGAMWQEQAGQEDAAAEAGQDGAALDGATLYDITAFGDEGGGPNNVAWRGLGGRVFGAALMGQLTWRNASTRRGGFDLGSAVLPRWRAAAVSNDARLRTLLRLLRDDPASAAPLAALLQAKGLPHGPAAALTAAQLSRAARDVFCATAFEGASASWRAASLFRVMNRPYYGKRRRDFVTWRNDATFRFGLLDVFVELRLRRANAPPPLCVALVSPLTAVAGADARMGPQGAPHTYLFNIERQRCVAVWRDSILRPERCHFAPPADGSRVDGDTAPRALRVALELFGGKGSAT